MSKSPVIYQVALCAAQEYISRGRGGAGGKQLGEQGCTPSAGEAMTNNCMTNNCMML